MTRTAADVVEEQTAKLRLGPATFVAQENFAGRLEDLKVLVAAHHALTGTGPGRRAERLQALDRAALVHVAGQFQGFVADLFLEAWRAKYSSNGEGVLQRLRINNALPEQDIDPMFAFLGVDQISMKADFRPGASPSAPPAKNAVPKFARAGEREKHQCRQVVSEMVRVRGHVSHGGKNVPVRLSDVMGYVIDCVHMAVGMANVLRTAGISPGP